MDIRLQYIVTSLVLLYLHVVSAQDDNEVATVIIRLQMIEFDSHGQDSKGENCDLAIWGGNEKKCDPEFEFCVDRHSGSNSMGSCRYFKEKTRHWTNEDEVEFRSDMKGVRNPIEVPIHSDVYEGIRFKVDVNDEDEANSDDDIDRFDWRVRPVPDRNLEEAIRHSERLDGERSGRKSRLDLHMWAYCGPNSYGVLRIDKGKTANRIQLYRLDLYMWAYCGPNSYGVDCIVYCIPVDNDSEGHYGCDLNTGEKYCLDGWEGLDVNCTIRVDNCEDRSCANGGVCEDLYDDFRCVCEPGYTGEFCDVEIDECDSDPCANGGTCVDKLNDYVCQCDSLHSGPNCAFHMCEHPENYCHHGGSCYVEEDDTLSCLCPEQYTGERCDVDMCEILNCVHGECIDGRCECEPNVSGRLCEFRECDRIPCQAGGTCLDDGTCVCTQERTGIFCERLVSLCNTVPCFFGATCVAVNDFKGFECRCPIGYNGTLCENKIPVDWNINYDRIIEKSGEEKTSGLADWALGLIIAVAILCLIIIIILTIMLKYRRKYRKSVHEAEVAASSTPRDLDNFVNPLYDTDAPPPTTVAYSASAASATIATTIVSDKKGIPENEEYGGGDAHPPPYTPHAGDMTGIPLPSYEESEERGASGAVGFVNEGFGRHENGAHFDDDIPIKVDCPESDNLANDNVTNAENMTSQSNDGYVTPSSVRGFHNPTYADLNASNSSANAAHSNANATDKKEPLYDEVRSSFPRPCGGQSQRPVSSANGEPIYSEIPSNRPIAGSEGYHVTLNGVTRDSTSVGGGNANMAFDTSLADNEMNASLEGCKL